MKVSILTQPLGHNYGGLLQAYALQRCLNKLGCEVETLYRRKHVPFKDRPISVVKQIIKKQPGFLKLMGVLKVSGNSYANIEQFRDRFISISPLIDSDKKLSSYYSKNNFDAFIVGSDQVWRPCYSPKLTNFFLDFCDELDLGAKRIAYAASFGVDHKEFSEEEVTVCRPLIRKFDAISVREDSGIVLVKEYFDVTAELVFDPTLLLNCMDYEYVIECDGSAGLKTSSGLLAYVLDMNDKKQEIVGKISTIVGETPSYLMNQPVITPGESSLHTSRYPRVGDWLNSFRISNFVVTDSFHGCIFAILFNKPFLVIGNKSRGLARFASLLKIFGMEDRLVDHIEEIDRSLVLNTIDWTDVNNVMNNGRKKSIEFLKSSLSM